MTEPSGELRAVVYIPDPADAEASVHCIEHIRDKGYTLVGVVARDWAAVWSMACQESADIIVIDHCSDLPPDRAPRIEVASQRPARTPAQRRTRIIRPDA